MGNNIYDELFRDEIIWGLHTTYNCDMAYSAELLLKQYKETAIGNVANKEGFAVFYNKSSGLKSTSKETDAKWFKDKFFFPLAKNNQTFHAKISLIKYRESDGNVGYRIAVYSKNHSFGYNCAEVGDVFELKEAGNSNTTNMLCDYLDTIYNGATSEGQSWLESNELCKNGSDYEYLNNCIAEDIYGNCVDIYFGGCNTSQQLGQCIDMANVNFKESLIITPPEFIRNSEHCKDFFKEKECLYDIKNNDEIPTVSHEKLYLIKKNDCTYHVWFGSANATPHGLGVRFYERKDETGKIIWNIWDPVPMEETSIECLVHKTIQENEYTTLKEQITGCYEVFKDFSKEGSLQNNKDSFANDLAQNCIANIKYLDCGGREIQEAVSLKDNAAKIVFELVASKNDIFEKYKDRTDYFQIIPSEYKGKSNNTPCTASVRDVCRSLFEKKSVTLNMQIDSYRPIKGTAYINDDVIMDLNIPKNLHICIETNPPSYSITLVSEWLQGKAKPLETYNDRKLQWFSDLIRNIQADRCITDSSNSANNTQKTTSFHEVDIPESVELKTQQMQFQKDGTTVLLRMLENNSRAFLADEAGLGKTYTSTGVMDALYEQFSNKQENSNKTFYVFYIAPNIPLLSKNCRDIVKKSKHSDKIIDLSNLSTLQAIVLNLEYYYDNRISEINKKLEATGNTVSKDDIDEKIFRELELDVNYVKSIKDYIDKKKRVRTAIKKSVANNRTEYHKIITKLSSIKRNELEKNRDALLEEKSFIVNKTKEWWENQSKTDKLHKYSSSEIESAYNIISDSRHMQITKSGYKELIKNAKEQSSLDRITFIWPYLERNAKKIKGKIVIFPIAERQILDDEDKRKGSNRENEIKNGYSREELTKSFCAKFNPNLIIWDEYQRYMGKMDGNKNPFMSWELESHNPGKNYTPFKALYLSATPYLSNKSKVDANAEKRYDDWNDKESKEKIPEFKDFAKLFAGGYSKESFNVKTITDAYNKFISSANKDDLEQILRKKMVRHERSRLQNVYEQHKILYKESYYTCEYAEVFLNTWKRMGKMKEAGFKEGTINQALNMPYFGAFMYRNKSKDSVYSVIEDKDNLDSSLFLPATLDSLPKECLGFNQLIASNISDEKSAIIWIPPTNPLYAPGENSIFDKHKKYSKTLVFAETIFYQRGYSYLLSRYTDEIANKCNISSEKLELKYAERVDELEKICDPWKFDGKQSLDEIISDIQKENKYGYEDIIASIAAPAVCAKRLNLDPKAYEGYFNAYFQRPGISNALGHWIENWINNNVQLIGNLNLNSPEEKIGLALLRYCAEGNLFAVLEEWIFVLNESDPVKLDKRFEQVLVNNEKGYTTVYPVSKSQFDNKEDADDSLKKECTFAERLVGDYLDCGSGENVEVKSNLSAKFSSPFWPMIMIAGRGAQEGMDYHEYCLRMMHLTLPAGPVSFEQRQGRIDRFRGLLVRRRVGKYFEEKSVDYNHTRKDLLKRQYAHLLKNKPEDNELYANYNMPEDEENYFERMLPFWDFSDEAREYHILENRLDSYRSSLGVYTRIENAIDLSASSILTVLKNDEEKV